MFSAQRVGAADRDCFSVLQAKNAECAEPADGGTPQPWCTQLNDNESVTEADACDVLASLAGAARIDDADTKELAETIVESAMEPERVTAVNKSGSAAQVEPVETARTIDLAGGAISLAATGNGTQGVATVTVNPWAIGADGAEEVSALRFADVSVIVPFDLDPESGADPGTFVGVRARLNIAAFTNTDELRTAFDAYLNQAGALEDQLTEILRQAPDAAACLDAMLSKQVVEPEPCGKALHEDKLVAEARAVAHDKIAKARRAADAHYFGLDLRADIGDQSLVSESTVDGFGLLVGLAAGVRLDVGRTWDLELRGRLAADYFHSSADGPDGRQLEPVYYVDGAAGLVLSGPVSPRISKQRLGFGLGVEGRKSVAPDEEAAEDSPASFFDLAMMVAVPTASGSDLSVGLRIPISSDGDRAPSVTVAGDFGLFANLPD